MLEYERWIWLGAAAILLIAYHLSDEERAKTKAKKETEKLNAEFNRRLMGEWKVDMHGIITEELLIRENANYIHITGADRTVLRGVWQVTHVADADHGQLLLQDADTGGEYSLDLEFLDDDRILGSSSGKNELFTRK